MAEPDHDVSGEEIGGLFDGEDESVVPADSLLTARFHAAREWLRAAYAARGASRSLHPLFSPATLTRLFKSSADYDDGSFSSSIQQRLIWLHEHGSEIGLYSAIEQMMGHTEIGRSIIFRDFVGSYNLFRFAADVPTRNIEHNDDDLISVRRDSYKDENEGMERVPLKLSFVEESFEIFCDDIGDPAFRYKSFENSNDNLMIQGAVFYALGHLFFPGLIIDGLNMSIVSATRSGVMQGLMLSVAKRGSGSPFSCRFLLVDKNKSLEIFSRLQGCDREKVFFDLTAGAYAYYMSV